MLYTLPKIFLQQVTVLLWFFLLMPEDSFFLHIYYPPSTFWRLWHFTGKEALPGKKGEVNWDLHSIEVKTAGTAGMMPESGSQFCSMGQGTERTNSKYWYTTSFMWRKVLERGARNVGTEWTEVDGHVFWAGWVCWRLCFVFTVMRLWWTLKSVAGPIPA